MTMTIKPNQPTTHGQPAEPLDVDPQVEAGRLQVAAQEAADEELGDTTKEKPLANRAVT
jgi:hypothetical protein